ncbi:recQ-mediated genome instability protein 1-like [Papaver somniferum]|uniref:recQ-mediated genome instability protein 1-like n=1 Tax=Papaver somniferum TaxID=3469 RepID=UPI000E701FAC|nr:recQ-mediated genome instability protein 1-like [Papaver somniferum]
MTHGVQFVVGMECKNIEDLHVLAPAGLKVEDLESARKKLIEKVDKLPRDKRTQTWVATPLASRATIAVWKPNDVDASAKGAITDNSTLQYIPSRYIYGSHYWLRETTEQVSGIYNRASNVECDPILRTTTAPSSINTFRRSRQPTQQETEIPNRESNFEGNTTSGVSAGFDINMVDVTVPTSEIDIAEKEIASPSSANNSNRLSGDKEIPFTYLATMLSDRAEKMDDAPCILNKIKCVMATIEEFSFKNRAKYQLLVSVDDGSLISEVYIDHQVVQS